MIPLLQEHLNTLQAQIDYDEQQLEVKKEEAANLQTIDNEVEQAFQTLNTVVDRLQDIDPESIALLKEATTSLFKTVQDDDLLSHNIEPEVSAIESRPIMAIVPETATEQSSHLIEGKQEKEITWRGIPIKILYQPNYSFMSDLAHIDVYCDQPLPITNTGYKSIFLPTREAPDIQSAANHVFDLLDTEARESKWESSNQLSLKLPAMTG